MSASSVDRSVKIVVQSPPSTDACTVERMLVNLFARALNVSCVSAAATTTGLKVRVSVPDAGARSS